MGFITKTTDRNAKRVCDKIYKTAWGMKQCRECTDATWIKPNNYSASIWISRKDFSSLNCSSSRSCWNSLRNPISFTLFLRKIDSICGGLLGFATKTWVSFLSCVNFYPTKWSAEMTHFENMKRFKLNIFTLVLQQIHHHLEIILVWDIACHDFEICTIQQDFTQ